MATSEAVLAFWLEELDQTQWYKQDDRVDAAIRDRFRETWDAAARGALDDWRLTARGTLALLLVLDQFPRNMFRGDPRSFATDRRALAVAQHAIAQDLDLLVPEPERQFFYLPFMHSESLTMQERGVRLIMLRMSEGDNLLHARAHRAVIRQFGRFPYRNDALSRGSTPAERAYIAAGGYGHTVNALSA
ncbi:MAG: DUF924 family protein [Rubricella sp.]